MVGGRKAKRQRLGIERLERRDLMAGDITVTLVDGNLEIVGDSAANELTIIGVAPGEFAITGDNGTVLHTPNSPEGTGSDTISDVTGNVTIRLKGGDDVLWMQGAEIAGNLDIQTNGGVDGVTLVSLTIGGDLSVNTGADQDGVIISDDGITPFQVTGTTDIALGGGDDFVDIAPATFADLIILGGSGFDVINFGDSQADNVSISGGGNDDQINLRSLNVLNDLTVMSGGGNDTINIGDGGAGVTVGGDLNVVTDGDSDIVFGVELSVTGSTLIRGGNSDDQIGFLDSQFFGAVEIRLGAGDDLLYLENTTFYDSVRLIGGNGTDTLIAINAQFLDEYFAKFEIEDIS